MTASSVARMIPRGRRATGTLRRFATPRTLVIGTVVVVAGYLVIVPLYFLLHDTFAGPGGFTLDGFARAYGANSQAGEMLLNSVVFAAGSAALALTLGASLAYIQVRTDAPFKRLTFAVALVPLIIPGIQYTVAWVFLADPNGGLVNSAIVEPLFGHSLNVFSLPGMIWVQGLHLSPVAFLLTAAAFRASDPSLEEAALASGAPRRVVLRRITLPLMRPALLAAGLLVFVQSLESFELPALLGLQNRTFVFASRIYYSLHQSPVDYGAAGAYAITLLALATAGLLLTGWLNRGSSRFHTVTGKAFRPRAIPLGGARRAVGGLVLVYFVISIALPVAVLLYASLLPYFHVDADALKSISLDNYKALADMPQWWTALRNTVVLGVGSATVVMALTAVAAWVVVRTRARGRRALDVLMFMPLVIPGIVLGVALAFVYLRTTLPIYGTLWILLIAFTTKYLPYGMRFAGTAMGQISSELEEAALASGASWWQMFRRVLLPLASAGVVAGWVFVLIISFRELSAAVLLYSPGKEVLSVLMWQQYFDGNFTVVAAIGFVMVAVLCVLSLIAHWVGGKFGIGADSAV
jgi:iron(III) transport system permease protein